MCAIKLSFISLCLKAFLSVFHHFGHGNERQGAAIYAAPPTRTLKDFMAFSETRDSSYFTIRHFHVFFPPSFNFRAEIPALHV